MANLNDIMEFEHVIRVDETGGTHDVPGVYAPEVMWEDVHPDGFYRPSAWHSGTEWIPATAPTGWAWIDGYSGQEGYRGPVMHPSEFIGGRMATDILADPGVYVAIVIDSYPEDDDGETEPVGWGVLRKVDA